MICILTAVTVRLYDSVSWCKLIILIWDCIVNVIYMRKIPIFQVSIELMKWMFKQGVCPTRPKVVFILGPQLKFQSGQVFFLIVVYLIGLVCVLNFLVLLIVHLSFNTPVGSVSVFVNINTPVDDVLVYQLIHTPVGIVSVFIINTPVCIYFVTCIL